MAQYIGTARSNYFAIKTDPADFLNDMAKYPELKVITQQQDEVTLYGFLDDDENGEGNVWTYFDEQTECHEEIEWVELFNKHLADNWVAIILECGAEKHRYLHGGAFAYNNKGESQSICIGDIFKLAENLGENITQATY